MAFKYAKCHAEWPKPEDEASGWNHHEDAFHTDPEDKYMLDLGWFPDEDPTGTYVLEFVATNVEWEEGGIVRVQSRDLILLTQFKDLIEANAEQLYADWKLRYDTWKDKKKK